METFIKNNFEEKKLLRKIELGKLIFEKKIFEKNRLIKVYTYH